MSILQPGGLAKGHTDSGTIALCVRGARTGLLQAFLAPHHVSSVRPYESSTARETLMADLPPNQLAYETNRGPAAPGSKAAFKVCVVTDTGNEEGSNALTLTRPATT